LVCAGWLAGRGPLGRPVGTRTLSLTPAALGAGALIAAVTLVIGWLTIQPLRSSNADAAALTAIARGDKAAAFAHARAAASDNPLSVDPLFELAALYHATGKDGAALTELKRAVALQPDNAATWLQEGELLLALGRPAAALQSLHRSARLEIGSVAAANGIKKAQAELNRR
jgi:tetratricopeptide (TPR) repeat protein